MEDVVVQRRAKKAPTSKRRLRGLTATNSDNTASSSASGGGAPASGGSDISAVLLGTAGLIAGNGGSSSGDNGNKTASSRIKVLLSLRPVKLILVVAVFAGASSVALYGLFHIEEASPGRTRTRTSAVAGSGTAGSKRRKERRTRLLPDDWSKYEDCKVRTPANRGKRKEWTTKPLWFPQYPNSIDDRVVRSLISKMTGLNSGAKSYYASSKNVKRCKGNTETAACLVVRK